MSRKKVALACSCEWSVMILFEIREDLFSVDSQDLCSRY